MKIIDISSELLNSCVYPGDPEPRLQRINKIENNDDFNLSAIYVGLHSGTHVDAPSHVFDEENAAIDSIPLETFIGPVQVITLPDGPITGEIVERIFPKDAKRVILRTRHESEFFAGAADDVAALNYKLLGYDKLSIGGFQELMVHRSLLGSGTVLLEGLDLSNVLHDGEYFLIAQPLKLEGVEASPVRAILIEDDIFWTSRMN